MSSAVAFEMSELHGVYAEDSLREEATRPETVRKGNYNGEVHSLKTDRASGEKCPYPGRVVASLRATLDIGGGKTKTQFVEVSHETRRVIVDAEGKRHYVAPGDEDYSKEYPLDGLSKLWGQIEAIVSPDGKKDVETILKDLPGRKFRFFVSEQFMHGETKDKQYPSTDAERTELFEADYAPTRNYVNSISPVRK